MCTEVLVLLCDTMPQILSCCSHLYKVSIRMWEHIHWSFTAGWNSHMNTSNFLVWKHYLVWLDRWFPLSLPHYLCLPPLSISTHPEIIKPSVLFLWERLIVRRVIFIDFKMPLAVMTLSVYTKIQTVDLMTCHQGCCALSSAI